MTNTTMPPISRHSVPDHPLKLTFLGVMKSEWIKLRSVRSIVVTLLAAGLVIIGVGVLASAIRSGAVTTEGGPPRAAQDPTATSLSGTQLAQLIIAIVGVLLVSSEYATGFMRATLAAVPRRLPVLAAKMAVFGIVVFVLSLVSTLTAFLAGQLVLGDAGVSLTDTGVLAAIAGASINLVGVGLIGVALGFLLRSTAAGIAVVVAIFFLVPVLLNIFSASFQDTIRPYLPSSAGTALSSVTRNSDYLAYGPGLALLAGWVLAFGMAAAVRFKRGDVG